MPRQRDRNPERQERRRCFLHWLCKQTAKQQAAMLDIIPRCSAVYLTGMYGAMGGRGLTPSLPYFPKTTLPERMPPPSCSTMSKSTPPPSTCGRPRPFPPRAITLPGLSTGLLLSRPPLLTGTIVPIADNKSSSLAIT